MQDFLEEGSFATTFLVDLVVSLVRSIQVVSSRAYCAWFISVLGFVYILIYGWCIGPSCNSCMYVFIIFFL